RAPPSHTSAMKARYRSAASAAVTWRGAGAAAGGRNSLVLTCPATGARAKTTRHVAVVMPASYARKRVADGHGSDIVVNKVHGPQARRPRLWRRPRGPCLPRRRGRPGDPRRPRPE